MVYGSSLYSGRSLLALISHLPRKLTAWTRTPKHLTNWLMAKLNADYAGVFKEPYTRAEIDDAMREGGGN